MPQQVGCFSSVAGLIMFPLVIVPDMSKFILVSCHFKTFTQDPRGNDAPYVHGAFQPNVPKQEFFY